MSHLRHATRGEVSLRNTRPFARELGGRMHIFAHSGRLPGIEQRLEGAGQRHAAIGSTDSEIAFCALLDPLRPQWIAGSPTLEARLAVVLGLARELRQLGPANFLYADGELLVAHRHRRLQADGSTAAPGLHILHRECAIDPGALAAAGVEIGHMQSVTWLASVPLTLDAWRPFAEGVVMVIRSGMVVAVQG
jgi:glutamine amidotransferase